ncbi:ribonuclease HII [Devosia sp. ZB163]|uniref:ribonuclease HII n=1 Tax=Devosia sp. ZB163 TaxID=3025938 RepID=UPI0023614419|nr:ribonuclease HII [Devosia sp. ZB163]MDC9823655.1 ribonuclease HII [Devosia sp. ZB163]
MKIDGQSDQVSAVTARPLASPAQLAMLEDMPPDSRPVVPTKPTLKFERAAIKLGATIVCGVDEAGRGPLAGPVVVSAVVLNHKRVPSGLNDSKVLSAADREELYKEIMAKAVVSISVMPPSVIARMNILQASLWGMRQAVLGLTVKADHVLVDGNLVPKDLPCAAQAIVGGDGKSVSIAAASIIAKVTRDRMCQIMDCEEPHFGFASHKGYAAPQHLEALTAHGPGRHHRMDFAPCAAAQRLKDAGIVAADQVVAA